MMLTQLRIRHPLYPALKPIPAAKATGLCLAITGTFQELEQAGAAGVRASRIVFPMHRIEGPSLSSSERDMLWELFQVPAYVLMLDGKGRVVAYECEAHSGLHLINQETRPVDGDIETSLCECGRPGSRVILT